MNTFVRIDHMGLRPGAELVLAARSGGVTMEAGTGGVATVCDVREQIAAGSLMSATALLAVGDGTQHRFLMLRRDDAAQPEPGRWQFPAARLRPDELPLAAACRALGTKVRVSGAASNWREVRIVVGGPEIEYLTDRAIESFRARYVFVDNTFEFYYPMTLRVPAFAALQLCDNEAYGRRVALFTPDEISALTMAGQLTPAARAIFDHEFGSQPSPKWLAAGGPPPRPALVGAFAAHGGR